MSSHIRVLVTGILLFFTAIQAFSLPRFALMTGTNCSSCHINPTGGQMRNEFGFAWGDDKLPLPGLRDDNFPMSPKLTDNLSFGFDYRSQFIYDNKARTTTFQAMTASLYGTVRLTSRVSVFLKQDIINGTYGNGYGGTEAFALLRILPGHGYLKAGSFLPDYGWKFDDHTHYTRGGELGSVGAGKGLIFTPNYKDIGIEAGTSAGSFMLTAGIFNGSGNTAPIGPSGEKAYAGTLSVHQECGGCNVRLGISGYGYKSFKMGGIFAGISMFDSTLVLLGETDWTHQSLAGTEVTENANAAALSSEIALQAFHGLWLVGSLDLFDPLQGIEDDEFSQGTNSIRRLTFGFEFYPFSSVELRPQYRMITEQPEGTSSQGIVQLHCWF